MPKPDLIDVEWADARGHISLMAALGRACEATNVTAEAEARAALGRFRLVIPMEIVEALRVLIPGLPKAAG